MMSSVERETLTVVNKRLIEIYNSDDIKQELEDYIRELTIITGTNKINISLIRD